MVHHHAPHHHRPECTRLLVAAAGEVERAAAGQRAPYFLVRGAPAYTTAVRSQAPGATPPVSEKPAARMVGVVE